MNVALSQHFSNQINGTIPDNGTLSQGFDLQGHAVIGLWAQLGVASTLTFEATYAPTGDYGAVVDETGAAVAIASIGTDPVVISADVMRTLAPYRYVRIKTADAQSGGADFWFVVKA